MAKRDEPYEKERRFLTHLEKLVLEGDRGGLAALRRGLGRPPGTAAEMHPYVAWATQGAESQWDEDRYYVLASLFALWYQGKDRPVPSPHRNLGASVRQWAWDSDKNRLNKDRFKSIERRFAALLNCHREDLPTHLRHAASLLKAKDVPVPWSQLLHDMAGWHREDRRVQRAWAKAFWAGESGEEKPTESVSADSTGEKSED